LLQVNFIRSGSHRGYRFRNDLCLSFFQLTQLLNAGFGIERAIHDLADLDVASSVRRLWLDISSRINSGQSLPDAMQHHQDAFDQTSIALIDAAHVNGQLSLACQSIHEYLQWQLDARSRMRTALIYPVFSLSVLLSVIVFLLVVVVPSMKGILLSGEASIAWHTQGLLWLSDWLTQYLLHSMVAASVLVGITHLCVKTLPTMRLIWDSLVLRLPLIGSLIVNLSLSRYSRCCAQLYGSSVSLERSLLLAEATVSNQTTRPV